MSFLIFIIAIPWIIQTPGRRFVKGWYTSIWIGQNQVWINLINKKLVKKLDSRCVIAYNLANHKNAITGTVIRYPMTERGPQAEKILKKT
jgi:hypothetical protein